MMWFRGFQRLRVGPVSYYYHPGNSINSETFVNSDAFERENVEAECIPIVFCHGIGVGLIFYMMLIDELMLLGRPLILPEITYVSGFRPWQYVFLLFFSFFPNHVLTRHTSNLPRSPNCVLPPAAVTSCLMSILACHGFARGAFLGHSYGSK
jgi:hypothetical protein